VVGASAVQTNVEAEAQGRITRTRATQPCNTSLKSLALFAERGLHKPHSTKLNVTFHSVGVKRLIDV
jgi:hypothetical protein